MSGIPYYKKVSGAKRRAEQQKKEKSEKKLLMKMSKISDMLKGSSSLTSQSASIEPESVPDDAPSTSTVYLPSLSTGQNQNIDLQSMSQSVEELPPDSISQLAYGTDPSEWDPLDDQLKVHLAKCNVLIET